MLLSFREVSKDGDGQWYAKNRIAINPLQVSAIIEHGACTYVYMIGAEASYICVDAPFDDVLAQLESVKNPVAAAISAHT